MSWILEGMTVTGKYMSIIPVKGKVELSRVAYGGEVKHTLVLDNPIRVYDAVRDRVILKHSEIESIRG
jgi:hypothetical protein